MSTPQNPSPETPKGPEEKKGFKATECVDEIKDYAKHNKKEAIIMVIAILGIIIMFFHFAIGGAIIGLLTGLFLPQDLKTSVKSFLFFYKAQNTFAKILFGAIILCFVLAAPFFFIGALAGIGIKSLM
jgi:hypothetical protein